ncbi:vanin-like protein 2 [Periplaneta americana]|uniref:vanin-like protein 2 n=1 Tax=Periplaneta americana TaxID=6978 RepID=UPI0037E847A9
MIWITQFALLGALCFVQPSFQASTPESPTYVAAVVEYAPYSKQANDSAYDVVSKNVENYINLIRSAASKGADIIVFPECGLVSYGLSTDFASALPNPDDHVNPCKNASSNVEKAIRELSCEAQNQNIYVLVNLPEKKECTRDSTEDCPRDGVIYYNSNVVFDRKGTVVARYRKFNLFGEPGFSVTPEPEFSMFETDFGVKFGTFTCFDIMFQHPAVTLVKGYGITDIVFPTAWFSELPFLTAVQAQTAWAHGMDVNFLGAGYSYPGVGSTGSGIYAGKEGSITAVMKTSSITQLLVANVTKKTSNYKVPPKMDFEKPVRFTVEPFPEKLKITGLYLKRDDVDVYETRLLGEKDFNGNQTLCYKDFCCQFDILMRTTNLSVEGKVSENGYVYRIAVFDDIRSYTFASGGLQICAVFACTNSSISSCGTELDAPATMDTKFDHIRISGTFRLGNATQLPNTLANNYETLKKNEFLFTKEEIPDRNEVNVTMETSVNNISLYTFAIYGRDFTKDGLESTQRDVRSAGSYVLSEATYVILVISFCITMRRFF